MPASRLRVKGWKQRFWIRWCRTSLLLALRMLFCSVPSVFICTGQNKKEFKTESIRKLSNFNFQWTKILYQNDLKKIAFFFTFFKGLRCNKSSVVTPKENFSWRSEKINVKFHKITSYTWNFRILPVFSQFLWNLTFIFSDSHEKFSLVLL